MKVLGEIEVGVASPEPVYEQIKNASSKGANSRFIEPGLGRIRITKIVAR